jgi:hypothetical protein
VLSAPGSDGIARRRHLVEGSPCAHSALGLNARLANSDGFRCPHRVIPEIDQFSQLQVVG